MNKTELVNALALRTGLSKKSAEDVLTTALDIITETLVQGEKVQLVGFGSFEVRERAPRIAAIPGPGRKSPSPPPGPSSLNRARCSKAPCPV